MPEPASIPATPENHDASELVEAYPPAMPAAAPSPAAPAVAAPGADGFVAPAPPAGVGGIGVNLRPAPTGDNVARGILLALVTIPVGVVLWVALWEAGFIASIVSFGIAIGATYLYRLGSGNTRIVPAAVWAIVGIIAVTLVLAFLGGIALDLANAAKLDFGSALGSPLFWTAYGRLLGDGAMWGQLSMTIVLSVLFAVLGCFRTIRRLVHESRAAAAAEVARP